MAVEHRDAVDRRAHREPCRRHRVAFDGRSFARTEDLQFRDAPLTAHARLVLSVDLIGQAVSVEVDASDVKAY